MFFYVDESGHTGPNLFDENQPILYYGVLSSKINLDAAAESLIKSQLHRGHTDEISINAISSRWTKWFAELPEVTDEQIEKGREIIKMDEDRRLQAIKNV